MRNRTAREFNFRRCNDVGQQPVSAKCEVSAGSNLHKKLFLQKRMISLSYCYMKLVQPIPLKQKRSSPCRRDFRFALEVVIDHRGRVDAALGPLQAPFRTLIELVVRAPAVGLSSEVRFPKLDMLRIANQLRRAQHGKEAILILLQLRPLMRAVGILNCQVVEAKFFLDPQ